VFATFSAGHTQADIQVALIDRPELLEYVLEGGCAGLDLIVLGEAELEALAGYRVREPWEAVAAIERLRGFGPEAVLASLGSGGVVLLDTTGAFHAEADTGAHDHAAEAPSVDALLSGFLTAGGRGPEALAAALLTAATNGHAPTVHVTWIDAIEVAQACTPS
jgi:fructose-1-phosphate kinase PfkB-like protein